MQSFIDHLMSPRCLVRLATSSVAALMLCSCGGSDSASPGPSAAAVTPPASGTPQGVVKLTWTANSEADLQGYRVYYGTAPGVYGQVQGAGIDAGTATEFTVLALQPGSTYHLAVTAYDQAGNESGYSSELIGIAK